MRRGLLRAGAAAAEALQCGSGAQPKAGAAALDGASGAFRSFQAVRALASIAQLPRQQVAGLGLVQAQRSISTSSFAAAEALTDVPVEGDVGSVLKGIDSVVSSDASTAKDVADAAVALAYVQAKGARRVWGKVFERAAAVKDQFDAAALSAFAWAATTANVHHFKTIFELAGPAAAVLKSATPAQLSTIVEALGKAGAADMELFAKVADQVIADIAKYKGAELARVLWGFAAAGQEDARLAKAAGTALAGKAGELAPREAVQAVWALARMRRADKPVLDSLIRVAASKMGTAESAVDAAALAWSLGFLGYPADGATKSALTGALRSGAAELTTAHAIDAAWGLALCGAADGPTVQALLGVASAAVEAAPDSLDVYQLAELYTVSVLVPGAKLPAKVEAYAASMYALSSDYARAKRASATNTFKHDVAETLARTLGAKFRPDVRAAVASYTTTTPEGLTIDIATTLSNGTKIAVEPVGGYYLTSANTVLGPALARARVLEAKGFKVVTVTQPEWAAQPGDGAKVAFLQGAIRKAGGSI